MPNATRNPLQPVPNGAAERAERPLFDWGPKPRRAADHSFRDPHVVELLSADGEPAA